MTGLRDQKVRDSTPFESLFYFWASFPDFSLAIPQPHLIPIPPPSLRGGFEQPLTFLYLFFEGGGRRGFCRLLCRDVGEGKGHEWPPPLLSLLASGGVLEKGWGGGMHKIPFSISGFRRAAMADPPTDRGRQQGDEDRPRPVAGASSSLCRYFVQLEESSIWSSVCFCECSRLSGGIPDETGGRRGLLV